MAPLLRGLLDQSADARLLNNVVFALSRLGEDVQPFLRQAVGDRRAYIRFNAEGFPYDWHLTVQRIVGEGQHAASWIEITGPGGSQPGLCFFDLADDGKIALITDFWPEPYELPASRAHLVERY